MPRGGKGHGTGHLVAQRAAEKPDIDTLLEDWSVHAPGMWENDDGPRDWHAVSNERDGIVAYFFHEADAFRFRLAEINRALND